MKTTLSFYKNIHLIYFVVILICTACVKKDITFSEELTSKLDTLPAVLPEPDSNITGITAQTIKAGITCEYSSPVGWCTAGVRLDKNGYNNGKGYICNIV